MQALLSAGCPELMILAMSLRLTLHMCIQTLKAEVLATRLCTYPTAWNRNILEELVVAELSGNSRIVVET